METLSRLKSATKSQLSSSSIIEYFTPGGEKIQRITYEIDGSLDWLLGLHVVHGIYCQKSLNRLLVPEPLSTNFLKVEGQLTGPGGFGLGGQRPKGAHDFFFCRGSSVAYSQLFGMGEQEYIPHVATKKLKYLFRTLDARKYLLS